MDKNLISIIVPAYNIAPFLPRCLDSILAQTHRELEIFVVDDGSTDETGAIVDAYAVRDGRIKPIHKQNGGVSSARMAGVAAATGEWIGFVDGDDYVEPEMFEHLLKNALEYNADISHCGYQMVFPDGHIDMYYNTKRKDFADRESGIQALLRGDHVEPGLWNKLFRRNIVQGSADSPLWDGSIRINEDLLLNYILFCRAKASVYEDIPFYHYILRKGSAATTKKPGLYKVQNPVRVMELILEDAKHTPLLYPVAAERYLRVLIGTVQQTDWPDEAVTAKQKLRQCLPEFGKLDGVSKKVLLMALGIVYMQPVYKLVRRVYNLFTGIDKKYDLE